MPLVQEAVEQLTAAGVRVLSPQDPRVVDRFGDFLFVASDRLRTIKTVQDRHHAAIAHSDFVWLVAPEGYVGQSAAMEIGVAATHGVPVYATETPLDLTLRQYVTPLGSPLEAVIRHPRSGPVLPSPLGSAVLLDPQAAADQAHRQIDALERRLLTRAKTPTEHDVETTNDVTWFMTCWDQSPRPQGAEESS